MKKTVTTISMNTVPPPPPPPAGAKKVSPEEAAVMKEGLLAQLKMIQEAEEQYVKQQEETRQRETAAKEKEYLTMIDEAEYFEKMALQATTDYDRRAFVKEAMEIRKKAAELYPEFSAKIETAIEEPVSGVDWKRLGFLLSGIMGLLLFSWGGFEVLRQKIIAFNSTLTIENMTSAMQPYGLDSFQKLFFEGFVTVVDLLILFGMLWVLDQTSFKYISNFVRGKHNSDKEFEELTAWQRQLKTTILLASALLYLALRHLVKA